MRTSLAGLCVWALCLCLGSCSTTYNMDRDEWDSLAGFTPGVEDPADPAELYTQRPLRRNMLLRMMTWSGFDRVFEAAFFMDTAPSFVENPAGLARDDFVGMTEKMNDSLDHTAEVAVRLLWIYENDIYHVLNQVKALSAAVAILKRDGVDPMTMPMPDSDREAAIRLVERDLGVIQSLWPGDQRVELSDEQRELYVAALRSLTRTPLYPLGLQRRLIASLHEAWLLESDGVLKPATEEAMRRAIHLGLSGVLFLGNIQRETALRVETIRGFNRLSGPKAVAFCLAFMGDPPGGKVSTWQFERMSPSERRLMVDLCGQLSGSYVYDPYVIKGRSKTRLGPKPIEFLYGRVRKNPEDDLNLIALEAMAHCLGHRVEQERDWADAWWLEYSLRDESSIDSAAAKPVGAQ